ncbi:MAG: hypothetical protein M3Q58_16510 [Bacteroidota bacterium]|nr:hypothetical protein [Bacteroidota bacterium]
MKKASFPVRWLIVLASTLAVLFLTVIVFAFFDGQEKISNLKEKLTKSVRDPEIKVDL